MDQESLRQLARNYAKVPATVVGQGEGDQPDDELACLQSALLEYSVARPQKLTVFVAASNQLSIDLLDLIPGWDDRHILEKLGYQIAGAGYPGEARLAELDWSVYSTEDEGWRLGLSPLIVTSSGNYVLHYAAPQVLTGDVCTIRPHDEHAFAHLAASFILSTAANSYAKNAATSISGDAVSQGEQSKAYSFQSKDERKLWTDHLAATRTGLSARVSWDMTRQGHNGLGRFWNRRGRIGL